MTMHTGQPVTEAIGPTAGVVGNNGSLLRATENALNMNSILTMVGTMDKSPAAGVRVGMPIDQVLGNGRSEYHAAAPQQGNGHGHHHHHGRGRLREALVTAKVIKAIDKLLHRLDTPQPTQQELVARANAEAEQRKAEGAKEEQRKAEIQKEEALKKTPPPRLG
jgi:hypothetical protein